MIRLYLLFLEYKMSITQFISIYIRGIIFSNITPFKLGELYKWKLFADKTENYSKSFFLIVIDRFFDTIVLSLLVLPYIYFGSGSRIISIISFMLVITLLVVFFVFEKSYKYLNNFLILNSKSERGLKALSLLEKLKDNYEYINNVTAGKKILMIVSSILAWSFELLAFMVFCGEIKIKFSYTYFVETINSGFLSIYKNEYIIYSTICISLAYFIVIGRKIYARHYRNNRWYKTRFKDS